MGASGQFSRDTEKILYQGRNKERPAGSPPHEISTLVLREE